ncbi:MAG: DUF4058 family protein [Planctomycetes bacterium]|nr:DUF4058 family protein [Planctomycetota bacterium]
MPVHDWTRVEAGIFHDFHHAWIEEIKRVLNSGVLPNGYYALAEQTAEGFGPDVLTLQEREPADGGEVVTALPSNGNGLLVAPPDVHVIARSNREFWRRKKSMIAVRHVSDDRTVAVIEVISPGNKASKNAFRAIVDKVYTLLEYKIHLLILDLFPPTRRDAQGLHAYFWEDIAGEQFAPPADKPLALISYESGLTTSAYVEPLAVGDRLKDMPVLVPLEQTYQAAFAATPRRWRRVLEPSA